jgi:hypothetical protein
MKAARSWRNLVVAAGLALGAGLIGAGGVGASEPPACCAYKVVTCYKTVTVLEDRTEAYTRVVTLYDRCGNPYEVERTCYRTVEVPVKKVVAFKKLVKVCE